MYYSTIKIWPVTKINVVWKYSLVSKIIIGSVDSDLFRRCDDGFMSRCSYHAFYDVQCSRNRLVFRAGELLFLSPVTIKLLSSAKYMGNLCIDECEDLSVSFTYDKPVALEFIRGLYMVATVR